MNNLKIAIYTKSFPPAGGGVATTHYNLINLLKPHFDVKVFVYDEDTNDFSNFYIKRRKNKFLERLVFKFIKFKYHSKSPSSTFASVKEIVSSFYPILKLNKKLNQFRPDIIIVPDKNVPHYLIKKPKDAQLMLIAHHNYKRFRNRPLLGLQDWLDADIATSMENKAMAKVDYVISPSSYMLNKYAQSTYNGVNQIIIPNFIDEALLSSNPISTPFDAFFNTGLVIYIPSAGSQIKGSKYVFEIIRRLSKHSESVRFYLSGQLKEELTVELNQFRDIILNPGHVNWLDNISLIQKCAFALSPTLEDNFSNALLEAQTLGLPVVTFDTGGNKEIIEDESSGFILPYLDVEGLIAQSVKLIDDANLRRVMAKRAEIQAHEKFGSNAILRTYKILFQQVLSHKLN